MLKAEALAAFRAERLVFEDVTFAVPPGGALLLLGPNGSGKSTLLRVLAGLGRAAAGKLFWNGEDALADPVLHARCIAYIGHQDAVKPGLTASENLRFAAAARKSGTGAIQGALEAVGLGPLANLPARLLSAGQKRRLSLARLALTHVPVWLLDEPTLGLDEAAIGAFGRLLEAHRAAGGLVVAATHVPLPLMDAATLRLGQS